MLALSMVSICLSFFQRQSKVLIFGTAKRNLISKKRQLVYTTSAPNKNVLVIPQKNGLLWEWEMPVWLQKHNTVFGAGQLCIKYRISAHLEKLLLREKVQF